MNIKKKWKGMKTWKKVLLIAVFVVVLLLIATVIFKWDVITGKSTEIKIGGIPDLTGTNSGPSSQPSTQPYTSDSGSRKW